MYYGSTLFSCLSSISTRPSSTNFWAKSNFQPTMEQLLRQNSIAIFVPYNSSNVYGQYRLASINRIDQRTVEQPSSTEFFAASSLFYILHKSLPCYANIQPLVFFFFYILALFSVLCSSTANILLAYYMHSEALALSPYLWIQIYAIEW